MANNEVLGVVVFIIIQLLAMAFVLPILWDATQLERRSREQQVLSLLLRSIIIWSVWVLFNPAYWILIIVVAPATGINVWPWWNWAAIGVNAVGQIVPAYLLLRIWMRISE